MHTGMFACVSTKCNTMLKILFVLVFSGTHIALILLAIHYVPEAIFNLARLIQCAGKTEIAQHV